VRVDTHFEPAENPVWPGETWANNGRALDQWLLEPALNHQHGYDANGKPLGPGDALLGDDWSEIQGFFYNRISAWWTLEQNVERSFKSFRGEVGNVGRYLVSRLDGLSAELALFYNRFNDYILLFNSGRVVGDTPVYLYQQDDADFYGIEFESEFRLVAGETGDLWFGLFGDMISGEFDDNGDVPRLPPSRLGARLSWSGDALGAWVSVLDAADQDDPGDFETETRGYTRWDAGVDYRWRLRESRELVAFLKWKNIGDEEIRLSTSFLRNYAPEAGESLEAGLRFTF